MKSQMLQCSIVKCKLISTRDTWIKEVGRISDSLTSHCGNSFFKKYLVNLYDFLVPFWGLNSFFFAFLLITLILVFAEITYKFIEVSGIKVGRK